MRIIKRETRGVSFIMKEYFKNRDYEDNISDVESQMYAPPGRVREYLENEPKKPFILCEYMHDMGNSLGGMNRISICWISMKNIRVVSFGII